MKKTLLALCIILLASPAFSENSETVKYMNQSQGFAGFNRSLPQANSYKNLERNTKYTAAQEETVDDELSKYDKDGWRIEEDKPVKTEKKVIKSINDGRARTSPSDVPMTYDKFPQNYGNGDSIMLPNMLMPMGNSLFK